ncbi:MAG: hypothetical protein MJ200_02705 [Mycoplasmoidaceae bacterium]|nr:hypothetical protein [Mycoplasmoidaceae bacterium]
MKLATSSEAIKQFRELLDNENFLREHNATLWIADPNSARKYLVDDSSEYLTQNDFMYLPLNI